MHLYVRLVFARREPQRFSIVNTLYYILLYVNRSELLNHGDESSPLLG